MMSPIAPYAVSAIGASSIVAATAASQIPWTEGSIAAAVVGASMFWIRRSDADARRDRQEMRQALHQQSREIAVLIKGYTDLGVPLPESYGELLAEIEREKEKHHP